MKENTKISVVIPTYNRSEKLRDLLDSLQTATQAIQNNIEIIIVNNNSSKFHTNNYIAAINDLKNKLNITYLFEQQQGRSFALNSGIRNAQSEFIAFIDDDELADKDWLRTIMNWIERNSSAFDYLVGPCLPNWETTPPDWLPALSNSYRGLLGWIEQSDKTESFHTFQGELCGGNCAIRRSTLIELGLFNVKLGRSSKNLMGGEDGDLHRKLKAAGKSGFYDPSMKIYHWIPSSRMTFKYHLTWSYWSGVSNRIRILTDPSQRENVPHLLGIPRYWIKRGFQGLGVFLFELFSFRLTSSSKCLIGAMDFIYLTGLVTGSLQHQRQQR